MADNDRNFDDVANHFANKIYGGLKGTLRLAVLWRDISEILPQLSSNQVLDIGAGISMTIPPAPMASVKAKLISTTPSAICPSTLIIMPR